MTMTYIEQLEEKLDKLENCEFFVNKNYLIGGYLKSLSISYSIEKVREVGNFDGFIVCNAKAFLTRVTAQGVRKSLEVSYKYYTKQVFTLGGIDDALESLRAIQLGDPGSFLGWADEYGKDHECIESMKSYLNHQMEWGEVSDFFSEDEIETLSEIIDLKYSGSRG